MVADPGRRIRRSHRATERALCPPAQPWLIVVDEEHEPTYKQQDPAPRYHARAVALRLAEALGATVVLGSATPDLETSLHTIHKQYQLFSLPDRPGTAGQPGALPSVEVVDLRTELKGGQPEHIQPGLAGGAGAYPALEPASRSVPQPARRGHLCAVPGLRRGDPLPPLRVAHDLPTARGSSCSAISVTCAARYPSGVRTAGAPALSSWGSARSGSNKRSARCCQAFASCAGTAILRRPAALTWSCWSALRP